VVGYTLGKKAQWFAVALTISIVGVTHGGQQTPTPPPPPQTFSYQGQNFEMDSYPVLFDQSTSVGRERSRLFTDYLKSSTEGRARCTKAKTTVPDQVWLTLTRDEQATFLAVTQSLDVVQPQSGKIRWIERIDEIHGDKSFASGSAYPSNKAFRLYAHMTADGANAIKNSLPLQKTCPKPAPLAWNGAGSKHPDFCQNGPSFDMERKTDNMPNIQFNLTPGTQCADIDLDYETGFAHLGRGNSDVLADDHTPKFESMYCRFGVRRK
jgi:hypothetical protein